MLQTGKVRWKPSKITLKGFVKSHPFWSMGGYTGQTFADETREILGASVEVAKRNELHTFAVIPQPGLLSVFLVG